MTPALRVALEARHNCHVRIVHFWAGKLITLITSVLVQDDMTVIVELH